MKMIVNGILNQRRDEGEHKFIVSALNYKKKTNIHYCVNVIIIRNYIIRNLCYYNFFLSGENKMKVD